MQQAKICRKKLGLKQISKTMTYVVRTVILCMVLSDMSLHFMVFNILIDRFFTYHADLNFNYSVQEKKEKLFKLIGNGSILFFK